MKFCDNQRCKQHVVVNYSRHAFEIGGEIVYFCDACFNAIKMSRKLPVGQRDDILVEKFKGG